MQYPVHLSMIVKCLSIFERMIFISNTAKLRPIQDLGPKGRGLLSGENLKVFWEKNSISLSKNFFLNLKKEMFTFLS